MRAHTFFTFNAPASFLSFISKSLFFLKDIFSKKSLLLSTSGEILANPNLLNLKFSGKDSIKISSNYLGINQKKIYNIYLKNFNN